MTQPIPNQTFRSSLLFSLVVLILAVPTVGAGESRVSLGISYDVPANRSALETVALNETIRVPDAAWLRLDFAGTQLHERGDWHLRITAHEDGAQQILSPKDLTHWGHTSAYFNGDSVTVQLLAGAHAQRGQLVIAAATVGYRDHADRSLCGDDDRLPLDDNRIARLMPVGCTGWLIDDANGGLLTAGHCAEAFTVAQFNVPPSTASGDLRHPAPQDQYAVDATSLQYSDRLSGNDWAYFGCYPNSLTGLTPRQAQGAAFRFGQPHPGRVVRIAGYGTNSNALWNRLLTQDKGELLEVEGHVLAYLADTTVGNSGSPVIDDETGESLGIHNAGHCGLDDAANEGTAMSQDGLLGALVTPKGVTEPYLRFELLHELPEYLDALHTTLMLQVSGRDLRRPAPNSGILHLDDGRGWQSVPMPELEEGIYRAVFPKMKCSNDVRFYFSAETTTGQRVQSLTFSPDGFYHRPAVATLQNLFSDPFITDLGWTVTNSDSLTSGMWQLGFPVGGGSRGIPVFDADGRGGCYLTDNADAANDVDQGSTSLHSPPLQTGTADAWLSYARWFAVQAGDDDIDAMTVWLTEDKGETWMLVERITVEDGRHLGRWVHRTLRLSDYVLPGATVQLRFDVTDLGNSSIVEAAVDAVRLTDGLEGRLCYSTCTADVDTNNAVDSTDLIVLAGTWGVSSPQEQETGRGTINIQDLIDVQLDFGICDPAMTADLRP